MATNTRRTKCTFTCIHAIWSAVTAPTGATSVRVPQCNNDDKRHRGFVLPEGVPWETGIEDGDIYLVSASFSTSQLL